MVIFATEKAEQQIPKQPLMVECSYGEELTVPLEGLWVAHAYTLEP